MGLVFPGAPDYGLYVSLCLWWALSPALPLSSDSRTQLLLHRVETLQNLSWELGSLLNQTLRVYAHKRDWEFLSQFIFLSSPGLM